MDQTTVVYRLNAGLTDQENEKRNSDCHSHSCKVHRTELVSFIRPGAGGVPRLKSTERRARQMDDED